MIGKLPGDPSWPTITVYNHLDVQPADPVEWDSPPFKFTREDEPGGPRWFGRGTTDDKGPALTALLGAQLAARDGVKANLQFLWELEEEIGSPHFEQGLQAARAEGFSTDLVAVSDTIWLSAGRPALPYGLRGLMGFTVSLTTGAKDVHSGTTGGAARNPIGELAQLIAECYDARTGRVKIPGFHDDVRKLSASERAGLRRAGFSRKRFQAAHELGSVRFRDDQQLAEAIMTRPTFEVHGIVGGYSGPGIKTIVPHAAEAKLSTRLVPDQDPEKVFKRIQRLHQGAVSRRRGDPPDLPGALPGRHRRALPRGRGGGDEGRLWPAARVDPRGGLDRRGPDHAPAAGGPGGVPGAVAARTRLSRRERELRLGAGRRRNRDVLRIFSSRR